MGNIHGSGVDGHPGAGGLRAGPVANRLAEVLSEFARILVTDFPIQSILDHLVLRIVDVLPVTAAGVTLIAPGRNPHYVAASDASAMRFEKLQTELGDGPCVLAYETGEAVFVPDLRADERFPGFTPRALESGLAAVFTFPLHDGDGRLGALDLYRTVAGQLSADEQAAAQTLADVAAAYLINARTRAGLTEAAARAAETSLHDALTGLPNRTLLLERLEQAVQRWRRSGRTVAILFADLDSFKAVNDTFGHHVGDQLLVAVAERLTSLLRPGDTLARLAGDEFVILCEDLNDAPEADALATRIIEGFHHPFALVGTEVQVTASVGIAFAGDGDAIPEQVLEDADTAMYQAKRSGGARHGVVDLGEQRLAKRRTRLTQNLRGAVARNELRTAYQPIVSLGDGTVSGAEALVRWDHPEEGTIGPAIMIPLAERSGLIIGIGRWVLERACADLNELQQEGDIPTEVSVNVSPEQLMAPDFSIMVETVLRESGIDAVRVTLELTESVFIRDSERALVVLDGLKRVGVKLALDDFGTGYSSLSYLAHFPVDQVKIDQTFVMDLQHQGTRMIVEAVVGLAHGLGMRVVAEGVETADQLEAVIALGCDGYQGFIFAPPLSIGEFAATLSRPDQRVH